MVTIETRVPLVIQRSGESERYRHIIDVGKKIFSGSNLLVDGGIITADDVSKIGRFNAEASPLNPHAPYIKEKGDAVVYEDPSTYNNWESKGGPQEHINLSTVGAGILYAEARRKIFELAEEVEIPEWITTARKRILEMNTFHLQAGAEFHDIGREITHIFFTNSLWGDKILKEIGIRDDIRSVLPDESVMLTPPDEDMNKVFQHMDPMAIMIRFIDEFAKRKPGTNRILQPEDFNSEYQKEWGKRYLSKPS